MCDVSGAVASTIPAVGSDAANVYFATDQPLLPSDGDASVDVYERSAGALSLATIGAPACRPGCGNGAFDVETTGGVHVVPGGVVFLTGESLTPADSDASTDIYRSSVEGPELLSQGPNGFNGAFDAELQAVADDGSAVVFITAERLVAADTDGARDVYERIDGTTTLLISQGTNFNGEFDATSPDSTPDGSAVLFLTAEPILSVDTDEAVDLYERQGGTTTLISRGTVPTNGDFDVGDTALTSDDGARNVFTTDEQVTAQDEDVVTDIYMRFGNTTSLVSGGSYDPLEGEYPAVLDALDPRANQVVFSSQQVLTEEDRDKTGPDVYETYYGKPILSSQGPAQPLLPPADTAEFLTYVPGGLGAIYFTTPERLVPSDTDSSPDVYERILGVPKATNPFERAEGTTLLVSQGPRNFNGAFEPALAAVSPDASRVFFTTAEPLVNADTDSAVDLYERFGGSATKLISAGAQNGNGPFDVTAAGGVEAPLFITAEQLVPGDMDHEADLYGRFEGRTRLISTAKPNPPAPTFGESDPATPSNVNTPSIRGAAEAGATVELFSNPTCAGLPLATGSAAQFASPGLPIAVPDNSTSSYFARATDANENPGSCSAAFAYVEDSIPGTASVTAVEPAGPANDNTPRIRGSAEADAIVRVFTVPTCQGPPAAVGSGAQLAGSGLAVGVPDDSTTSFFVEATDRAGNVSQCAGAVSYSEDSTPPETTIESGPRPSNRSRKPFFQLGSSDADATFICTIDRKPSRPCDRAFRIPGLRLGKHRISAAAVDVAGNVDPTPAFRAWKLQGKRHRHRAHR